MARQLTFRIKNRDYPATPRKIDRRKLYGWTEVLALDDAGEACAVVTTDQTGRFIIPRGGTAMGLLTPRGEWVERSELVAVDAEGKPAELLPSSYEAPVELRRKVSIDEFLEHDITDFYQLDDAPEALKNAVGQTIFGFDYCYLSGCEGAPAFVLQSEGVLYLLIGRRLRYEMVGYEQPQFIDVADDEDPDEELDFAMF